MSSIGETATTCSDSLSNCSGGSSDDEDITLEARGLKFEGKLDDTLSRHYEVKSLKAVISQLQTELSSERESTFSFRRKLTQANKEKFQQAAKFNEDTLAYQTKNASLQAQLEKQIDYTEQLEFELAKAKKQIEKDKTVASQRCQASTATIEQLEEALKNLQTKLAAAQSQSSDNEKSMEAQIEQLRETINDRDRILKETVQQHQNTLAEQETLNQLIQQQEITIQAHVEQFGELQQEFEKTRDHLRDANSRVDALTLSEQQYKSEVEDLKSRGRELSEGIEAERTAHLESKFNSELVQLKIGDLENACETQRNINEELQETVDNLTTKLRDIEQAYNDELTNHKTTSAKLERCEKEYAMSQRQLQMELTDKRSLVSSLKQQLDVHQTNVDDLKTELSRAKKRQKYFEETYGSSMRELELIVSNFDHSSKQMSVSKPESLSSPHVVLDTIKHTLQIYKQNLEETTAELKKMSETYVQVSQENSTTRDKLWAKEKALEETQRALNHATKEVEVLRHSASDQQDRLSSLSDSLQQVKKEYEGLQQQYTSLNNDLTHTRMSHLEQDEQKMRFMHGLYQRLLLSSEDGNSKLKTQSFEKFKWDDLSEMVLEQSVSLVTKVMQLSKQVDHLELQTDSKADMIENAKVEYEKRIADLSEKMENSAKTWSDEKAAMEKEYKGMISDGQRQQQLLQKTYDDAWEQIRQASSTIDGLEKETGNLKTRVSALQKHNSSLLCAFALVCGAYFPLLMRSRQLSQQRNILEEQLSRYGNFKQQIGTLLQTLTSDSLSDSPHSTRPSARSLLKFRKAVLAVMAANRLLHGITSSRRTFTYTDSQNSLSLINIGSLRLARQRRASNQTTEPYPVTDNDVIDWLSNKEVIACVMSATEDIMDALRRNSQKDRGARPGFLVSAARTSFKKLIGQMAALYPMKESSELSLLHKERYNFVKALNKGLNTVLSSCAVEDKTVLVPSLQVLTSLQERVLTFIKMLHDSEMERKSLRQKAAALLESETELKKSQIIIEKLEAELTSVRNKQDEMVTVEKFEGVAVELESTLARERKIQELLHEQNNKLREMERQMSEEEVKRAQQEMHLRESLTIAEKSKDEVTAKSAAIQQLKTKVSQLELERTQLQDNIFEAEQALRATVKDREHMSTFVKTLSSAFEQCRTEAVRKDISKMLASKNVLPECQATSEMFALQSLVSSYIDTLRSIHKCMAGLNDEIVSHKKHIARLKEELTAACSRQLSAPVQMLGDPHPGDSAPYNCMESTRLGHYTDMNYLPKIDKLLDLHSEGDFISVNNEPEFSAEDSSSVDKAPEKQSTNLNPKRQGSKAKSSSAFQPTHKRISANNRRDRR